MPKGHKASPLENRFWTLKEKANGNSQKGFIKGKLHLTNLTALYDEMTRFVDDGRAAVAICPDFSKVFNMVSCSILCLCVGMLQCYTLEGWTTREVKNWLHHWVQNVVVNDHIVSEGHLEVEFLRGFVLGPILFDIFISGVEEETNAPLSIF